MEDVVIVSDYAGEGLARRVAERLLTKYIHIKMPRFADGEPDTEITENVRGRDAFFICPFYPDPTARYAEIALSLSALKYSSAGKIIAVPTYLGFMKKDWKDRPRVPISIRDVAIMMEQYAQKLLTMDMHSPQEESAFRIPLDHLDGTVLFAQHAKENYDLSNIRVTSPDLGGVKRVRQLAKRLGQTDIAMVYKLRDESGDPEAQKFLGDVENRDVLFVDDQAVTLKSLNEATKKVKEKGAKRVIAYCTHPIMAESDGITAEQRLADSMIERLYVTDTIPRPDSYFEANPKLGLISAVDLFARAIKGEHKKESISALFV